jgi:Dyp-type peroxidase family
MTQAKGVIPRGEDKEVLYKNPEMCGYFIAVKLSPDLDRPGVETWLSSVDGLIARLVERLPAETGEERGQKVASVAVGFSSSFFALGNLEPRPDPPASFRSAIPGGAADLPEVENPLANVVTAVPGAAAIDADVMFYVASIYEARVNQFLADLGALKPAVASISMDRGFQRLDETEPFGYKDGLRNIRTIERSRHVFVHRDERHFEEPSWADDGTYMAFLRIVQHPEAFAALPDDATRDATMGRQKDGQRLDLAGQDIDPHDEPPELGQGMPSNSHVAKAGPRGRHDEIQIFRRGLPFIETESGQIRVGLNFCSFQASLDQFEVVFGDWMMNSRFPVDGTGLDALFDPNRQLVTIEKAGFFFVPPYRDEGLAAAVLAKKPEPRKPKTGRLVVHKRVADPSDPSKRFERGGFVFQVFDSAGQPIGGEFVSDSTGRAIAPEELEIDAAFTLKELRSEFVQNVPPRDIPFTMDAPRKELMVMNSVAQPNTPYGG